MIEIFFGSGDMLLAIPFLAIAGLAAAAAGAVGSGVSGANKRRTINQMRANVNNELAQNRSWYNANALSDYTQRADAQNLFKHLRDNLKRRRTVTAATAAVTGATPAAQAAAKESDARAISDTYSNVAAMGQRWKDNITNQYLRRQDYLNSRLMGVDNLQLNEQSQMQQNWQNLMGTGLNTAISAFPQQYAKMYPQSGQLTTSQKIANEYMNL